MSHEEVLNRRKENRTLLGAILKRNGNGQEMSMEEGKEHSPEVIR